MHHQLRTQPQAQLRANLLSFLTGCDWDGWLCDRPAPAAALGSSRTSLLKVLSAPREKPLMWLSSMALMLLSFTTLVPTWIALRPCVILPARIWAGER